MDPIDPNALDKSYMENKDDPDVLANLHAQITAAEQELGIIREQIEFRLTQLVPTEDDGYDRETGEKKVRWLPYVTPGGQHITVKPAEQGYKNWKRELLVSDVIDSLFGVPGKNSGPVGRMDVPDEKGNAHAVVNLSELKRELLNCLSISGAKQPISGLGLRKGKYADYGATGRVKVIIG